MTRKQLAKKIAKNTGLTIRDAENLIIAFGATVSDALQEDDKVLYSNFGTFYTVHYPSKTIYHPKKGKKKKMVMLPTNVAKWKPSDNLKDMVEHEEVAENPTQHAAKKNRTKKKKKIKNKPLEKITAEESNKKSHPEPNSKDTRKSFDGLKKTNSKSSKKTQNNDTEKSDEEHIPITIQKKKQLSHDEDIEAYHAKKGSNKQSASTNIYEELMTGKGISNNPQPEEKKEGFSPFKIIRNRFAEKKDDGKDVKTESNSENDKVSLAGTGIFSPDKIKDVQKEKKKTGGEEKIDTIKNELKTDTNPSSLPQKAQPESMSENRIKTESNTDKETNSKMKDAGMFADQGKNKIVFDKPNIKYRDLSGLKVEKATLAKIPEKIARKYKAVPVELTDNQIIVAMIDPEDIEAKEILKRLVQEDLEIVLATESDINHVLAQYQGLESEVSSAIATIDEESEQEKDDAEIEARSDDAPAARIVDSLLKRAIRDEASDIHIEPTEKEVEVRFRIDGVLKKRVTLPNKIQAAVISRIKILSNLKIDEQRLPQDGRFNIMVDNRRVDFRVSTMPIANGEKVVMRILDKETGILTIEELGITGEAKARLENEIEKSHGMVLVTGPTGSGKTTTLYAVIDKVYSEGVNIVTLEDPIEYQMKGINQSQVNSEIGFTFANGLRALVRQDPDIIMLGEIRDGETADMAVHAALTGHVVLSTLHTNDAAGAIPRLVDMGVEPFLLTSSINAVIGQRLARKICPKCKQKINIPANELKTIEEEIEKMPKDVKEKVKKKKLEFFEGSGCKHCDNSGHKGRIGLFEMLPVSNPIKDLIIEGVSSNRIQEKAIEEGMTTMIQDGILKALEGETTMKEVWRVTKE